MKDASRCGGSFYNGVVRSMSASDVYSCHPITNRQHSEIAIRGLTTHPSIFSSGHNLGTVSPPLRGPSQVANLVSGAGQAFQTADPAPASASGPVTNARSGYTAAAGA